MSNEPSVNNVLKGVYQLATLVLMIFGAIYLYNHFYKNSGANPVSASPVTTAKATTPTSMPRIGMPFANGQFSIIVHNSRCGIESIGNNNEGGTMQPTGQFCSVSMTATNISKSPAGFDDTTDVGTDPSGRQFTASATADIYGNESANLSAGDGINGASVNPTFSISGNILFDVPKGDTLTRIVIQTANAATLNLYSTTVLLTR